MNHSASLLVCLGVVLCLFAATFAVRAEQAELPLAQWPTPPSGESVASLESVKRIVMAFDQEESERIVIRYPGGDAGTAWAEELRDWLVALGISSSRVLLQPGSGKAETIVLETESLQRP